MIQLRPKQTDLINDIREAFKIDRKVLAVAPTGFGKTVVFSYLASTVMARNKRVYILVHREELIDQVSRTLADFSVPHGFIAAGRSDIALPVMVCSVFTLANRMDSYPEPELLIVDEAHHAAAGSTWGRVIGTWNRSYILGVTATPIRLDGRDLSGNFGVMVEGPTVGRLIADRDLCPYRMYTPPVVLGKLRMRMGDYNKTDMQIAMDKPQITGNAVAHYTKLAAGKRALVFCTSLIHSEHTRDSFREAGYRAEMIDGKLDKSERRRRVQQFTDGRIQVLTSCELVNEGFDLPAIEVAILLRPTMSLGLYLQQVGRALRNSPGKAEALILDHAGNAGEHGLPDDEREWSLGEEQSKAKKKKKPTGVRMCGRCYGASKPGTMVCLHPLPDGSICNFQWPIEAREIEQKVGELQEIDAEIARTKLEARKEVGMSKTLESLVALERQRGYKPGWAMHIWQARSGRR